MLALLGAVFLGFVPKMDDAVVYEANLRAFGPKVGFAALTARLDAIRTLGVNVLWIMPVQPVGKLRSAGGLGSPYAPADFDAVNPEFGTPADLRHLVQEAHRRKMAVILDWVADHTAWDSPWLTAHPDWYMHDAGGNVTIPAGTNWRDVAQLNYKNKPMRGAMIASMKGWISRYGIDGFRCDAADYVPLDFWKEAIAQLRTASRKPLFMLAEGFRPDYYTAGFDLTYGWNFYSKLKEIYNGAKATELASAVANESKGLPDGARRLRFTTNHDESAWQGTTLDFFKTAEGARTAFAITTLYGGAPLIYCGQEVAWPKRIPIFEQSAIEWNRDRQNVQWMSKLLALRRAHPAFRTGKLEDASTDDAILFRRYQGSDEVLVVGNVRASKTTVSLPENARGVWRDGGTERSVRLSTTAEIPPFGCRIYVRKLPLHGSSSLEALP